jgi:ABC-2 type transport system permease protein
MADVMPSIGRVLSGQVRYQLMLIARTPRAFMFGLLMPGLLLALEVGRRHVGDAALASTVAGLVVFGTLSVAYLSYAAGLVSAREEGVLRRWHATPLPPWAYFAGRIIATVVMADLAGVILLMVGVGMAGLHISAAAVGSLLLANTIGGIALAAAGTAITPLVPTTQGANGMLALTYLPLLIFSGGFGTISGLPHWLSELMTYLPVQPVVNASTQALLNPGGVMPVRDLIVLGAWTLGCLLLSVRFFRWDPHRPRHARKESARAKATAPAAAEAT